MSNLKIPKTGIKGLKENFKADLISGFSISLIALPLCLGIAMASNFPPITGVFTAIAGGILASRISGSFVTIYGPAAGLIVVNLSAVESLGQGDTVAGYHYALAAILIAGIVIYLFGLLKVGGLGDFFPASAVHGMLAAIGIIILVKQIFVALGTKSQGGELFEVIADIPRGLTDLNPYIAIIAATSLAILIIHPMLKFKYVKMVPAPIWVLAITIPMAHVYNLFEEHTYIFAGQVYSIGSQYLIHLPDSILDGVVFPDFGKIATSTFWVTVMSIALVTSLESMLSAAAVDTLDVYKRKSNLNKDLSAVGAGSALSALVGGLPVISEIVRSSANVISGARTQWANFFHGAFLLLFLLVGKRLIDQIPSAALAAMLIITGYRLASPKQFRHVYEIGSSQLIIFVTTIIAVLATDLLIGIGIGIITELLLHYFNGVPVHRTFKAKTETLTNEEKSTVKVHDVAIFSNYLSIKKKIIEQNGKKEISLDFKEVHFVDHTVMNKIEGLKREFKNEGKHLKIVNDGHLVPTSNHPLSVRKAKKQ